MQNAGSLSNRLKGLECQIAAARARAAAGASGALGPAFVFRPGGVAGGNVYTSWASLMAAAKQRSGPVWIEVDSSLAAANVTAGAWAFDSVTLLARDQTSALTFEQGATLAAATLTVIGLIIETDSAAPVMTLAGYEDINLLLGGGVLAGAGAAPFFDVTGGGPLFNLSLGFLGDGTLPVVTVAAGQSAGIYALANSQIGAAALAGAGTVNAAVDVSSTIGGGQTVATLNRTLNVLTDIKSLSFSQEVNNGNSGAAKNIDWTAGPKQTVTLTANTTLTFTAPPGPCTVTLRLVQDATGGRTVTWPATVKWAGAAAPVLTAAANAVDVVSLYWNGATYYGVASLNFA
jgi:hypothetical protein